VTSDNFLPGTVVMLHSFLQHHKQFRGDICIIHDGLSLQSQAILEDNFQSLKFLTASSRLTEKLDALVAAQPKIASRRARFLSIEMFALSGYDKLLFCDSDMLFRGSVADLFAQQAELICCGDGAHYHGNARDPETFLEVSPETSCDALEQTFNAGFMLFDASLCNAENYAALIDMISPERWQKIQTGHTDQMLYNVHFAGRQKLASPAYNYLLAYSDAIIQKSGAKLSEALVLHYNGPVKPWSPGAILENFQDRPMLIQSVQIWNKAFTDFLSQAHLREEFLDKARPDKDIDA